MKRYTVTESSEVVLNGCKYLLESGDQLTLFEEGDWPKDVDEGDLRGRMGLKKSEPLEDQTSPSDVAEFYQNTDKSGRGMVMFAVNSNQGNDFWKQVHKKIKEASDE